MENSGNNRYELLFLDEESGAPLTTATVEKKKQPNASVNAVKKAAQSVPAKKSIANPEKENKASTLNKNETGKKSTNGVPTTANTNKKVQLNVNGPAAGGNNGRKVGEGQRQQQPQRGEGGESRDQRPYRQYPPRDGPRFASGGEFGGNDQRPPRQFRDRDSRGPPRNRFGENGYRGKREFDRQSGSDKTGVKAVDKREGGGAHNWGSAKQDIEDANKAPAVGEGEAALTDKEESSNEQQAEQAGGSAPEEEEETKEMTLDEWKAMREQRTKPQYNLRKAGEGEDTAQWKKMVVLNKKKVGEDSEEEFEYDPSMYPQRVGRLQRIIDIQFNFNDGRRGGGSGFGRGRGGGGGGGASGGTGRPVGGDRGEQRYDATRGRGPRPGGDRGDRGERRYDEVAVTSNVNGGKYSRNFAGKTRNGPGALKVDDEHQFPTLS